MKFIFYVIIALTIYTDSFSQNGRPATDLMREAFVKTKAEKKNLFVVWTASWCHPCKELKRGLHDVYNSSYFSNNYVILELYANELEGARDLENGGADSILKIYHGDTTGIPYWMILAPTGKKLYGQLGFSSNVDELKAFISILKRTSHLREGELQMIYDRFRQLSKQVLE